MSATVPVTTEVIYPTFRPLVSDFPQPSGCDKNWYVTTTERDSPSSVLSSGWLDPRYASCQPDGEAQPTPWFSPGICPGQMTTAGFNPIGIDNGVLWAATCCQDGFAYVSANASASAAASCSSTVTAMTLVPVLFTSGPSAGDFSSATAATVQDYIWSLPAVHEPVLAFFAGSDLCNFPTAMSAQLVSATESYIVEHSAMTSPLGGNVFPTATSSPTTPDLPAISLHAREEECVRIQIAGNRSGGRKISGGTIGGAVAGAVVGLLVLAGTLFFFVRRRRRTRRANDADQRPELGGTEKDQGDTTTELHGDAKAAELGTHRPEATPTELAAYDYHEGIPELDAQEWSRGAEPAPLPAEVLQ